MKYLISVVLGWFLSHVLPAENLLAQNNPTTILCFGNSITAGYGISPEQAYPAILETMIKEDGKDCRVINAGLSGETSAGGFSRINWVIRQPIDIFLLELGGNDGLRGLPLDQTENNLQAIVDAVTSKYPEVQVVIAGMMVPPNMGEEYGTRFIKIFPALAQKNNATLIPFILKDVGGIPELNLPDGIHPTPEGHRILAKTVFEAIKPLLK